MALDLDSIHVRLAKAQGQIAAVDRMIASGDSAERILVQINAAKAALHKVALLVSEDAVAGMVGSSNEEEAKVILERFSSLL